MDGALEIVSTTKPASIRSILALLSLKGLGRRTVRNLLIHSVADKPLESLLAFGPSGTKFEPNAIQHAYEHADEILRKSESDGIRTISYFDAEFPQALRAIEDAPILIHVKGNVALLSAWPAVAIIGTRNPTKYGEGSAKRIAQAFAEQGISVVSGLALGCDAAAHRGCLDGAGKTVAVLAHGLDSVYPAENKKLAEEILSHSGCLVSEYEIGQKSFRNNFVERNRLQSGLASALVLVEAALSSGSMHTVRFAQQQKRLIACVKHPRSFEEFDQTGANRKLLEDGEAIPLSSSDDVLKLIETLRGFPAADVQFPPASSDAASRQSSMF